MTDPTSMDPARSDALVDGETPRDADERALVEVMAQLRAQTPSAPDALRQRVEAIAADASGQAAATPRRWWTGLLARPLAAGGLAAAVVAAVVGVSMMSRTPTADTQASPEAAMRAEPGFGGAAPATRNRAPAPADAAAPRAAAPAPSTEARPVVRLVVDSGDPAAATVAVRSALRQRGARLGVGRVETRGGVRYLLPVADPGPLDTLDPDLRAAVAAADAGGAAPRDRALADALARVWADPANASARRLLSSRERAAATLAAGEPATVIVEFRPR